MVALEIFPTTRRLQLAFVALAAALVATAGCSGDEQLVSPDRASRLVLRAADLPAEFTVFDSGPVQSRDTPPGPREDPDRFGREAGWKARFRRPGGPETRGPFVVESRADVFGAADGAEDELSAYRLQYEDALDDRGVTGRPLRDPALGDGAVGFTLLQESDLADVRFYALAWRIENVVGSLLVSGFERKLTLEDVVALARKQLARIRAEL